MVPPNQNGHNKILLLKAYCLFICQLTGAYCLEAVTYRISQPWLLAWRKTILILLRIWGRREQRTQRKHYFVPFPVVRIGIPCAAGTGRVSCSPSHPSNGSRNVFMAHWGLRRVGNMTQVLSALPAATMKSGSTPPLLTRSISLFIRISFRWKGNEFPLHNCICYSSMY